MKKSNKIKIFFLIQLLIIINSWFSNSAILGLILNIFLCLFYLVFIKNKSKKEILYLILSLITATLYSSYLEKQIFNIMKLTFNYMYFPITLVTILRIVDKEKINKTNMINVFILLANVLGIVSIVLSLLSKDNLIFNINTIITILLPITFTYFNKKSILNYLITIIPIVAICLSKINLFMIVGSLFIIFMLVKSVKEKKSNVTTGYLAIVTILISIFTITDIISNKQSFIGEFFTQKTFYNMMVEIVIYYISLLYVTFNIFKGVKKHKNKMNLSTRMLYSSVIISLVLGILSSRIFDLPLFVVVYIIVLTLTKKKIESYNKQLTEDKITILALHLGYGGIEQYLSSLCKMLKDDYQIEIISTYKLQETPAFEFNKDIKIKYLINRRPNKSELKNALKKKKYINIFKEGIKSIVILYKKIFDNIEEVENITSKYIITTRDFQNYIAGEFGREDIIKIATEHNYHNDNKKYVSKIIESVSKVNYFVLVSEELRDFYSDKVNSKCLYIPNVIDALPKKESKANNHTLISIGRLSKEKGQLDLIDVVSILKNKYKDIKLYLIGDGEEKDTITDYVNKNKLGKNVVLTGFLSKNDIELKVLESSVFVTTSYTESFGLVVIEACSYKLPVVAFDSAKGVKNILSNGNGILVSDRNKEKMAKEIIKLFEDREYLEKISTKGYNNCKKYLAKNVKKEWIALLK